MMMVTEGSQCGSINLINYIFLSIVVNDKKGALGILKIYRNFRNEPGEFNHLPQTQVFGILKNILFSPVAKKCSMESQNKKVYLHVKNIGSK